MNNSVIRNKYGFFELVEKPNYLELKEYYSNRYYQEDRSTYSHTYSDEEIQYFNNKIQQKYFLIKDKFEGKISLRLLDVGCGEGFAINFFQKLGWQVTGVDYSSHSCKLHNPDCASSIIEGDIINSLKILQHKSENFDFIWLDNVLEHVLDPLSVLKLCKNLGRNALLMIEVPNDFSILQLYALKNNLIENEFWVISPDHISYFNRAGLKNICDAAGWKEYKTISDFPIDFNLFNRNSNYIIDKEKGESVHSQRIKIENFLHNISIEKVNNFYEALAQLELGRQIISIFENK